MNEFEHFKKVLREKKFMMDEFIEFGTYYRKDVRACNSINKTLGTNFRGVYRELNDYSKQLKANNVDFDTGLTYIITHDYRVLCFNNSEWFSITEEK